MWYELLSVSSPRIIADEEYSQGFDYKVVEQGFYSARYKITTSKRSYGIRQNYRVIRKLKNLYTL